jgi:hypothetical protein
MYIERVNARIVSVIKRVMLSGGIRDIFSAMFIFVIVNKAGEGLIILTLYPH